jgi:sugar phosphate isomerase/epimerase
MADLKISAFADEYADPFAEQLQALKQLGITNIEIRFLNGKNISTLEKNEIAEAKRMLDDLGIKVSAIGSPLGKIKLDADINSHLETARRVFEAANLLETKFIRMFSFYAPDGKKISEMKSETLDPLEKFVVLAREYGVILCHENEANIYGDTPERCRELLDYFGGELKCVFDMGNFVLEGVEPYAAYSLLREDIAYFHIKDALSQGAIVPAGKGEAKIKEILSAHREYAKEDFFVSLEPHLQTFSGLNALATRNFKNPYQYADQKVAFVDAVTKFREII